MPTKVSKVKTQKPKALPSEAKPTKKAVPKKVGRKSSKTKLPDVLLSNVQNSLLNLQQTTRPLVSNLKNYRPTTSIYVSLIVAGVLLLAVYNKSLFVAATVNGSPVSNLELQNRLNQQYREQTLNQMVNEKIVLDEAKKKGVVVSTIEVGKQISVLEKSVGGTQALDGLLAQQGQTRASLKDQILIQLTIEKMYSKDATVSAEEINQFLNQNKDQLQATTPAEQQKEAEDALKQQKLSQIFRDKFQQLKQAAKVQLF